MNANRKQIIIISCVIPMMTVYTMTKYTQIIIAPARAALWLEGLCNRCSRLNLTDLNRERRVLQITFQARQFFLRLPDCQLTAATASSTFL